MIKKDRVVRCYGSCRLYGYAENALQEFRVRIIKEKVCKSENNKINGLLTRRQIYFLS